MTKANARGKEHLETPENTGVKRHYKNNQGPNIKQY